MSALLCIDVPDDADMHAAAVAYAIAGLPVFPLQPGTKEPATAHGFHDATWLVAEILDWWDRNPHYNIGCAVPPGMVAVDIDVQHGGDTEFAKLVDQYGRLPETWVAQTGNGGWHYWFRTTVSRFEPTLCPGVDLKPGGKGYVLMPPSVHPNGRRYQWVTRERSIPAPAPTWLETMMAKPVRARPAGPPRPPAAAGGNPQYVNAVIEGELNKLAGATPGGKNGAGVDDTLTAVAYRLFGLAKGGHVDAAAARDEMKRIAMALGHSDAYADKTLDSAWDRTQPEHPPQPEGLSAYTIDPKDFQ